MSAQEKIDTIEVVQQCSTENLQSSPMTTSLVAVVVSGKFEKENNFRIRSFRQVVRSVEQSEEDTWGKLCRSFVS